MLMRVIKMLTALTELLTKCFNKLELPLWVSLTQDGPPVEVR